jgi:FRG domain
MSEPEPEGDRGRTETRRMVSWEDFEHEIKKFEHPKRKPWDEVWFRGQSDATWQLHTTLERRSMSVRAVSAYLNLIGEIKPAIETFTGATFEMPNRVDVEKSCREYDRFEFALREFTTYLAHLRHCGFPSPLLDWSRSPYVAAYFAFARTRHDGDVAIYAYRERPVNFKIGDSDLPQIVSFGPIVKTHKRHFRQQSRYTTCVRYIDGQWYFEPHDSVFGMKDNLQQDLLWKITIPAKERLKVLEHLDKFNLNEFTLFDSEEALLEMLAMRVIDMREHQ